MSHATKFAVVAAFVAALGISNAASARAHLHPQPLTRCGPGLAAGARRRYEVSLRLRHSGRNQHRDLCDRDVVRDPSQYHGGGALRERTGAV